MGVLFSTSTDADGSAGIGPVLRRFLQAGFYNGDFVSPPASATSEVSAANPLPYWLLVKLSGTAIQATSIVDTAAASGRSLQFSMGPGAAGDDIYVEQIIPVNGARGQSYTYLPSATFLTGPTVSSARMYCNAQYLKADGVTTTGTTSDFPVTTTSTGANTLRDIQPSPNSGAIPTDAYYLRVRVGFQRDAAATTVVETVTVCEVRLTVGGTQLVATEGTTPGTYGYAVLYATGGTLWLAANQGGASGTQPAINLEGVAAGGRVYLRSTNNAGVRLRAADAGQDPWIEFIERTDPSAPAANECRLYARDNGAGKTQLVVVFNTGAVQVIATQP